MSLPPRTAHPLFLPAAQQVCGVVVLIAGPKPHAMARGQDFDEPPRGEDQDARSHEAGEW